MTFYEAALEVLRASGAPMHYEAIALAAIEKDLLSHAGRLPEAIMGSRLSAMAAREPPGDLVAVESGTFGLSEWGLTHVPEALEGALPEDRGEGPPMRGPERNPQPLKEAQRGAESERAGRWDIIEEEARARSRKRRRRPRGGETPIEALVALVREVGGGPIDLLYVADATWRQEDLPESFPRELDGLRGLAEAENDRCQNAGLTPTFDLEGDRIALRPPLAVGGPPPDPRPTRNDDNARQVIRKLVPALRGLDGDGLEGVVRSACMRMGLVDFKTAARDQEGWPLFTARVAFGAGRIRVACRVQHGGHDLRVSDIERMRSDQSHCGAGIGVVVSTGKATTAARAAAEDPTLAPVLLLDAAALADLCLKLGVGVRYAYEESLSLDTEALRLFGARS